MTLERKIVGGTVSVLGALVLARAGIFLANIAIVRVLGSERVGQLALVEVFLTLVASFSLVGLGLAITRSVALYAESEPAHAGRLIGAAYLLVAAFCAVTIIVIWVAVSFANPVVSDVTRRSLRPLLPLLTALAVVSAARDVQVSVLYGLQVYRPLVRVNAVIGALSFPVLYLPARLGGVQGAVAGRLVLLFVELVLITHLARSVLRANQIGVDMGIERDGARELFRFGFGSFVGQLPASPTQAFLADLLVAQRRGLQQYGLYATAGRLAFLVNFVPNAMATTFVPILTSEWKQEDDTRYANAISSALRLIVMVTLPLVILFAVASPVLLRYLYGPEFEQAWPLAFTLLVLTLLFAINEPVDRAYAAAGRIWLSSANNYFGAMCLIGLGLVLIPRHRALGYALAVVIAFGAYTAVQVWRLGQVLRIRLEGVGTLVGIAGGSLALALGASTGLRRAPLALVAAAGLLTAGTTLVLYRLVLTPAERAGLWRRIRAWTPARRAGSSTDLGGEVSDG